MLATLRTARIVRQRPPGLVICRPHSISRASDGRLVVLLELPAPAGCAALPVPLTGEAAGEVIPLLGLPAIALLRAPWFNPGELWLIDARPLVSEDE